MVNLSSTSKFAISIEDFQYLKSIYPTALEVLRKNGYGRVFMTNFSHIYPAWKLQQDIEEVGMRKQKYERDSDIDRIKGIILEAIILDCFESLWVTEGIFTHRASLHDDYKHGADIVVTSDLSEIAGDNSFSNIVFDVTTAIKFLNKLNRSIKKEGVTSLEYFYSEDLNIPPQKILRKVPHIVIHVSNGSLKQLTEMWIACKNRIDGSNESLANHPIQLIILKQIILQLDFYQSKWNKRLDEKVKVKIRKWLAFFEKIYNNKKEELNISEREICENESVKKIQSCLGNRRS